MASRNGQSVREALDYLAVAEREAQDMVAGLARMRTHAGLALTVSDAVDVIRLVNTIVVRADAVIEALCTRIDTLDACAEEPQEALTHVAGVAH